MSFVVVCDCDISNKRVQHSSKYYKIRLARIESMNSSKLLVATEALFPPVVFSTGACVVIVGVIIPPVWPPPPGAIIKLRG